MNVNINNPFTPTFGKRPAILAGRDRLISDVLSGIENLPGDPNRVTIFTGPRGSGKTVLLSQIAFETEQRGWVSANITSGDGMLEKCIEQIKDKINELYKSPSKSSITGINIPGFGITREIKKESSSSYRKQISDLLNPIEQNGSGLLITIDEVRASIPELIEIVSDFQHFVREEKNVALIMAGLPGNIDQLLQDKSVSFLRRAFYRELKPINKEEVKLVLKKTIEMAGKKVDSDSLSEMANQSEGFPLMIQLIGYYVWRQAKRKNITIENVEDGLVSAKADLEHMILDATIKEISDMDLRFLLAMLADAKESKISDIARRMEVNTNLASRYRIRLIRQGIIMPSGRGKVLIALPKLKELLEEHYKE